MIYNLLNLILTVVQVQQEGDEIAVNLFKKLFFRSTGTKCSKISKECKCSSTHLTVLLSFHTTRIIQ